MKRLVVSDAVRHIYVIRRLKVKVYGALYSCNFRTYVQISAL
jgi:hypothetical protein